MVRLGSALLNRDSRRQKVAFLVCIAVGLALSSPCVSTGWVADDYFHQLMLRPTPGVAGLAYRPFDLFRFASGDPRAAWQLMDEGVFAWWTDPHAVLAFFRPLSSATHWLDYRLWPSSPIWMHVHSLAWFLALLGVVAAIYRRFSERSGAAELSLLLFAIDDAHAPVVGWIANRNQLVALALALPALLVHDRYRAQGFRQGAWLGPLIFGAGLFASEAALIAGAYLVAYAAVFDGSSRWRRFSSLLPYAGVVLVWLAVYRLLGYGATGSGLYADPVRAPLSFAAAVLERLPVLLLSQLALPWADLWEVYPLTFPWLRWVVGVLAWVVLLGFSALVIHLGRSSRCVRFWSLGALLALVPVCASFPHDRLLLGAGIGVMALIAELLLRAIRARTTLKGRLALGVLVPLHLVLSPLLLPLRAARTDDFNRLIDAADRTIPKTPDVTRRRVVLVNPPLDPFAAYFPVYRQARGVPRPQHLLWLNSGVTDLTITGIDERSLRVRAKDGFLSSSSQLMLRDAKHPPSPNVPISLSTATIRISETTEDGRPLEIVVTFHEPLRSDGLLFLEWKAHGYVPFTPPAPGESVLVPALDLASTLFG
jgi:hypothetical protein